MTRTQVRRTLPGRFDIGVTIIAFGICLIGLLWSGVVLKIRAEEKAEISELMKDTANLARAVEEHAVRTVREADQVLLSLLSQIRLQGSKPDLRQLIEDGPILSRIYTYFSIIDERGNLVAGSQPFKPMNLSDREHFQVHVAREILNQPFISKPVVGRASGKASIQITRRINKPDLSFGGVAVVAIDPDYLTQFYSQLDIGKKGVATLVGRDGIVRAQRAGSNVTATPDVKKWSLFKHLETSKSGSYLATNAADGLTRIFSYRTLPDHPLVVVVGVEMEDALAVFYQRSRNYQQAAAFASLVILGFTGFLLLLVSRRKRAEAGRAQLAAIVQSSDDAIISITPDGVILTWNEGARRLFGHTAMQAIGQPFTLLYPATEYPKAWSDLEAVKRGERHYEAMRVRRDGGLIPVSVTAFPIQDGNGKITGIGVSYRNIAERKKAEAVQAELSAIVEQSNDAIVSRSTDGKFQSWNKGAERMFGYSAVEAIGRSISMILPPEERSAVEQKLQQTLRGEDVPPYETRRVTKDGRVIDVLASVSPVKDRTGSVTSVSIIFHDITERKKSQERIAYLSQYDALTGLPNRSLFQDRLELAIAHARRRNEVLGVLLVNLDRFKKVNESLGHEAGDELLRKVASRLKSSLREVDTIARLGGNDYAVLVEGIKATDDVTAIADKLIQMLASPFDMAGQAIFVSASVGIAVCSNGDCVAGKLLEGAEIAMSRAKQDGGGDHSLFQDEPITLSGKRLTFETRLRHALENGELAAHYQPKVSLLTGDITGAEALLRWNSPQLGHVSPAEFIPIAEETGLIVPMGAWILEAACTQAALWRRQGHDLNIAVNLSPRQFRQKDLVSMVAEILERSGLEAQRLELEITEGTAMKNAEQTIGMLNELHRLGVKFAVDDFGTGYSSLGYLKRFPLHCLKIDRSFVSDAVEDPNSKAIVRATLALAHSLNLKVVAEGVETEALRDFLAEAGCDEYQGYFFSRPLPAMEFSALLERSREINLPHTDLVPAPAERHDLDPTVSDLGAGRR